MEFDLSKITNKLDALITKADKLDFLNELIVNHKHTLIEFKFNESSNLKRLKLRTKSDFEKYCQAFENGNLIYFTDSQNENIAKLYGFENIDLLRERIRLTDRFEFLTAKIEMFKNLKEQIENTNDESNTLLYNYNTFIWEIECELNNLHLITRSVNEINKTFREVSFRKIKTLSHRAKQEIENLIFIPNNNSNLVINKLNNDIDRITKSIDTIKKKYNFNHCDIMPKVIPYFDFIQVFWDFKDYFINLELPTPLFKNEPIEEKYTTTWESEKPNNQTHIEQINETPISNKKQAKPEKNLNDFIFNVNDKDLFVSELKNTFNTEYGKLIRILIDTLKKEEIIKHNNREFKKLCQCLSLYFNRYLGTPQSINDYKKFRKEDLEFISNKLKSLLIKHKTI